MKKIRLFILCYAISIGILSTGCTKILESKESKTQSVETETEIESETELEFHRIKASIVAKCNGKEIFLYSDATCLCSIGLNIRDGDYIAEEGFSKIEINKGETIRLTLEDLAPGFFSDEAIIEDISVLSDPCVYVESELNEENYESSGARILLKGSSDKLVIYSDEDCYYDLLLTIQDSNFYCEGFFRRIKLSKGKTVTVTLEDLAPGFFSKDAVITHYYEPSGSRYVEKK